VYERVSEQNQPFNQGKKDTESGAKLPEFTQRKAIVDKIA
jgi:hypothetical protein